MSDYKASVYLVFHPLGFIKIGIANNVASRYSSLQTATPLKLTLVGSKEFDNARSVELLLHKELAADRVHGERFLTDYRTFCHVAAFLEIPLRDFWERNFALAHFWLQPHKHLSAHHQWSKVDKLEAESEEMLPEDNAPAMESLYQYAVKFTRN